MSPRVSVLFASLALCFAPVALPAADDAKPITIELKSFKFPTEQADLFGYNEGDEKLFLYTNGKVNAKVKVPAEGNYELVVKASGDKALNEGAKFKVAVDGKEVGKETETGDGEPKEYKFPVSLKAGEHELAIEFTNDVYKEGEYDRNLYIYAVTVTKSKK